MTQALHPILVAARISLDINLAGHYRRKSRQPRTDHKHTRRMNYNVKLLFFAKPYLVLKRIVKTLGNVPNRNFIRKANVIYGMYVVWLKTPLLDQRITPLLEPLAAIGVSVNQD